MCKSKQKNSKNKLELNGYYFDGEKSWIIYQDEHGNETIEEDKDEQQTQNGSKEEVRGRY